jgi:putative hydrolase of the HAD superfamily
VVAAHLRLLLGRAPNQAEVALAAEEFRAASRRELTLFPGVKEALAGLRSRFGVGLVSNAQLLFTRPELEQLGLRGLFAPLVISSEVGARKPSKHIFRRALEQAGCAPQEALHVGNDPLEDVEGAASAGLHTCLVEDRKSVV